MIVATILLFSVAGLVYSLYLKEMYKDHGHQMLIAFGYPRDGQMQMDAAVGFKMLRRDPPRMNHKGQILVMDWISEHFELRDKSGERVGIRRTGMSGLLIDARASSSADFYLKVMLDPGETYTMDYIPVTAESKRYRCTFAAPHEPEDPWHKVFLPVEDELAIPAEASLVPGG